MVMTQERPKDLSRCQERSADGQSVAADIMGEEDNLKVVRVMHVLPETLVSWLLCRVDVHHLPVPPVFQLQAPLVVSNHLSNPQSATSLPISLGYAVDLNSDTLKSDKS
jgi:hypothetical protein